MAYPKVLSFKKKRKNKNKNLQYLIKSVLKLWSHSKVLHLDLGPLVISAMLEFRNYAYRTLNLFSPLLTFIYNVCIAVESFSWKKKTGNLCLFSFFVI